MEWVGVLLLYLISGFMKKRQQNKNRKIIESDPEWDNEDYLEPEQPPNNFEQLLNDLFEQNPKTPDPSSNIKDLLTSENENQVEDMRFKKPLVLVCIDSYDSESGRIFQAIFRDVQDLIRFAILCTAPNSKCADFQTFF